MDADRRIVSVNKSTCLALKKAPEELLGKHCYEVFHHTDKPWFDCPAAKTFKTKQTNSGEVNDPNLGMPLMVTTSPILNKKGELIQCIHIAKDLTEQKQTEKDLTLALEALSYNLDKIQTLNEKLRVVGSLTRHDVRNKLSAIPGYSYLIKKKHGDQADIVEGLRKMDQAVKDAVRIFDFAKMYEQLGAEELSLIDVSRTITDALEMLSEPLNLKVICECQGLSLLADSALTQLFFNLIDNTRKYGEKTTTIRVRYEKADNDNLKLIYEDDGVGISTENKPQLFKKGFSTGGSTGFGLFLIKEMMEVYGWSIEEIGAPSEGVKFVVTIPKTNKIGDIAYQIKSSSV
jgi:signal transduction histidine kinase